MKLPRGRLLRRRVVTDVATPLATALDAGRTGYLRLASQDALLLDAEGVGVVTVRDGIPTAAYHTGTDRGGPAALADMAVAGPYRLAAFELDADALEPIHETETLRVPPGMPAERLGGDAALAERTRRQAPSGQPTGDATEADGAGTGAVEAFLEDEQKIEAIRNRARAEAERRAAEWDL